MVRYHPDVLCFLESLEIPDYLVHPLAQGVRRVRASHLFLALPFALQVLPFQETLLCQELPDFLAFQLLLYLLLNQENLVVPEWNVHLVPVVRVVPELLVGLMGLAGRLTPVARYLPVILFVPSYHHHPEVLGAPVILCSLARRSRNLEEEDR